MKNIEANFMAQPFRPIKYLWFALLRAVIPVNVRL